jgi:hypothetical protein
VSKKIYVYYDTDDISENFTTTIIFANKNDILKYFQKRYPRAKHLRLKIEKGGYNFPDRVYVLNHNNPVTHWYERIRGVTVWDGKTL